MGTSASALPVEIPLFPLPNVVCFPGAAIPLHIFEPRYRTMVRDCLAGERVLGLVLAHDDPRGIADPAPAFPLAPPMHAVGAAGRIVQHHPLADGRSYIVVEGLRRFRISDVWLDQPYLTARVAYLCSPTLPDAESRTLHATLCEAFAGYLAACRGDTRAALRRAEAAPDAATAADLIAASLDLPAARRQALLELLDPAARGAAVLAELLAVGEQAAVAEAARRNGWPPPAFSPN